MENIKLKLISRAIKELPEKEQNDYIISIIKERDETIKSAKKAGFHGLAAGMEFFINQNYNGDDNEKC